MSFLNLRLRIFFVSLIAVLVVACGSAYYFSKSWLDLSRAYGFLSLNRRLESVISNSENIDASKFETGEWMVEYSKTSSGGIRPSWKIMPDGLSDSSRKMLHQQLWAEIRTTHLDNGSFEVNLDLGENSHEYFVAFSKINNSYLAIGTSSHMNLWQLSLWAAPFLGNITVAIVICALMSFSLANRLQKAYVMIGRAMENVGAGRYGNLILPTGSDKAINELTGSLIKMTKTLEAKDQKIAEVSQLADEDHMTGLPNYRAFTTFIESMDSKKGFNPVLAIVDLDFFKKVNDTYGHQVGDLVLKVLAQLMRTTMRMEHHPDRPRDFVGRYGGEEFVGIFSNVSPGNYHIGPLRLLKAIRALKIEVPAVISESNKPFVLRITASMGYSVYDLERFPSLTEWIKEADESLYAAKHGGRDRLCCIYPKTQTWTQ